MAEQLEVPSPEKLDRTGADLLASVLRAAVSTAPVVGGLLAELVNVSIPRLREERLADFARRLEMKVAGLGEEVLKAAVHVPGRIDLMEEAARQALKAELADRRERLACLVREAMTVEERDLERMQRLLSLLGQLNDSELLVLRSHVFSEGGIRTRQANPDLTYGRFIPSNGPEGEKHKECLRRSYIEHLVAVGLLEREIQMTPDGEGRRIPVPQVDRSTKQLSTSGPRITELGEVLLKSVDFYPN